MKLIYPAVFYPAENGAFAIEFPDLRGCVSGGDNIAEALTMASDAACGWIVDNINRGKAVPMPSNPKSIKIDADEPNAFVNLLVLDMDEFAEKYQFSDILCTEPAYSETFVHTT